MTPNLTLGVDSGTQSTKVVACTAEGEVVAASQAAHPDGCVQHPDAWWDALVVAVTQLDPGILAGVEAVAIAGQQHGCVPLGEALEVLGPATLWCDTSAAPEAERLNSMANFATEVGSRLVASFTIAKLAKIPEATIAVCLPHDWLNLRITGSFATDRGDASGTGWWDAHRGIRRDLLALGRREDLRVPEPLEPDEPAGFLLPAAARQLGLRPGITVGCGTGDNMAVALGVGALEGEVIVSLGTSGTAFTVSPRSTHDLAGLVAGFADATGRYLPLVCSLNCTEPVETVARWLGLEIREALGMADIPTPVTFLPYLRGERTPNLPSATGAMIGLSRQTTPSELLAAAVQGAAFGLARGVEALVHAGVAAPTSVTVVGGGAQHLTWRHALADATTLPVSAPAPNHYAARGMAAQARSILERISVRQVAESWRPAKAESTHPRKGRQGSTRHEELLTALGPMWGV
ncbi:MAG: FGGY family carbohydrate kinase [Candidatus Dormibacteria bacterium]